MDIKLEKRAWYIRHKYWLIAGVALIALAALNVSMIVGPRTILVDGGDIETGEAIVADFHEYIDVSGIVQPILNIKVNCREGGYISHIVAGNGAMLEEGDTILTIENPRQARHHPAVQARVFRFHRYRHLHALHGHLSGT